MYERSGSRCRPSGVGTQRSTASHAARSAKSDVARIRPRRKAVATRSGPMCRMLGGARVQGARLLGINVEADDGKPGLLEEEREREAHVTEPDHADDGRGTPTRFS